MGKIIVYTWDKRLPPKSDTAIGGKMYAAICHGVSSDVRVGVG